ncbi:hypothetical protein GCM10008018_20300 [Paenibacillus marchantiophytorum]|uniref:Uncharacterized protein n=1 Tax=Paenibacillus marchantiophytorum TaxID=1619310 RepID=A0ABQ2BT45_9BACL|nr:hypothetical protein [Paenibacillus marchantiophytorum]GGI47066.1 hypothetical protein GCM10008018_20300 [Paenibacillus marchantiophytorum]
MLKIKKKYRYMFSSFIIIAIILISYNHFLSSEEADCGIEKAGSFNLKGRACIWNAYTDQRVAKFTIERPSIDSGPFIYEIKTTGSINLQLIQDTRADGMSYPPEVNNFDCKRLEKSHFFTYKFNFKDCDDNQQQGDIDRL